MQVAIRHPNVVIDWSSSLLFIKRRNDERFFEGMVNATLEYAWTFEKKLI